MTLLALAWLLLGAAPGHALWKTLKTSGVTLFYPQSRERQALEVLAVLESTSGYVEQVLGHRPRRVAVVLTDVGIQASGLTDPVFRRILLYPYSPSPTAGGSPASLWTLQSWWRLLWAHEYGHWVHLDMASGAPRVLTALFGNILAPNIFAPTWLLEGVCVYVESGHSPYEGRLNDGVFAAYAAALAREGALPSIAAATFQGSEFPGGAGPYLYGGLFLGYLVETYGEEALREFLRGTSSSLLSYLSPLVPALGLDRSARRAFGLPFPTLWRQWQAAQGQQAGALSAPPAGLTDRPGWIEEPAAWGGKLYFRRSRVLDSRPLETRRVHELVRLDPDSGSEEVLVRGTGPFTGPLVVREGTLYYALLELGGGFANSELAGYGFTAELWELDLQTLRRRKLFRAPLRSFAVLEDRELLCSLDREQAFGSTLALFRRSAGALDPLFETDYLVAEIECGPAGLFVTARRDGESFGVYRVHASWLPAGAELTGAALLAARAAGTLSPEELVLEPLLGSPFNEGRLCLAGGRLYFSTNPEGRYRIYGMDLASGRMEVSDSLEYQDAPAFDPGTGRLYALTLEPRGYTVAELPDPLGRGDGQAAGRREAPGWVQEALPRLQEPPLPEDGIRRGGYLDNLGTLLPRALLPLLSFDSSTWDVQAGGALLGRSALGDLQYHLSVFYDSGTGNAEVDAALGWQPALPLQAELSFATSGTDTLGLAVLSPLVRSLTPGLWYVTVGAAARLFDVGFNRLELAPVLGLGLRWPYTDLGLRLRLPLESTALGSARDALALTAGLELRQLLGPLELGFQAVGVSSFDGSVWRLPGLPMYPEGLPAVLGAAARMDLWIPVLRVRRGLWNPGFHVEDLYLAAFGEAALNESLALQLSYGGELHLELRVLAAATGVPVDLFVRLAVDLDGRPGVSFGLETISLDDYIRSAQKEVRKP